MQRSSPVTVGLHTHTHTHTHTYIYIYVCVCVQAQTHPIYTHILSHLMLAYGRKITV